MPRLKLAATSPAAIGKKLNHTLLRPVLETHGHHMLNLPQASQPPSSSPSRMTYLMRHTRFSTVPHLNAEAGNPAHPTPSSPLMDRAHTPRNPAKTILILLRRHLQHRLLLFSSVLPSILSAFSPPVLLCEGFLSFHPFPLVLSRSR